MELKFECPTCGQHISVPHAQIGITIRCPNCNAAVTVPNAPKQRQAQLKIWWIPVGNPPPVAPVPERIMPDYSCRAIVISALVILLLILFVIMALRDHAR
jgi:DNA-directed RNA polymerase subunit RPC12/RpoP